MKSSLIASYVLVAMVGLGGCIDRGSPSIRETAKAAGVRETAETERLLAQSEKLQSLDKLCRELPYFRDIRPNVKSVDKNRATLFYDYKYVEAPNIVYPKVKEYFAAQGWAFVRENNGFWEHQIEFESGDYWVQVTHGDFGESNYGTACRKK